MKVWNRMFRGTGDLKPQIAGTKDRITPPQSTCHVRAGNTPALNRRWKVIRTFTEAKEANRIVRTIGFAEGRDIAIPLSR